MDSGHPSGAPALLLCPDCTDTQPANYIVLVLLKVGCWEPNEVRFRVAFPKAQKLRVRRVCRLLESHSVSLSMRGKLGWSGQ